jgi:hypothetical protein
VKASGKLVLRCFQRIQCITFARYIAKDDEKRIQKAMAPPSASLFQNLDALDVKSEQARRATIPLDSDGLAHGQLQTNNLTYFVKRNRKPSQRAALALVVRVG